MDLANPLLNVLQFADNDIALMAKKNSKHTMEARVRKEINVLLLFGNSVDNWSILNKQPYISPCY